MMPMMVLVGHRFLSLDRLRRPGPPARVLGRERPPEDHIRDSLGHCHDGAPDPVGLGRQLHLIYDGAGLAGRMDHHEPAIAPSARQAVQALLDAGLPRAFRHRKRGPKPPR
jgi:hypothetical protein